MDELLEKRILIDAVDCKISQLEELKAKLVNEHNTELMRRQQVSRQNDIRQTMPDVVMEETDDNVSEESKK